MESILCISRDREIPANENDELSLNGAHDENEASTSELEEGDTVQFRHAHRSAMIGMVIEVKRDRRITWVTIRDNQNQFYTVNKNLVWKITRMEEITSDEASDEADNPSW